MTWYHWGMKTMILSEFKAKCIAVLKQAQREREPLVVTRWGHPIARIEPVVDELPSRKLGRLKGKMKIKGDIVHMDSSDDWEMIR